MKQILNKGTLVICVLFLVTLILVKFDPIGLNPDGINGTSVKPALYCIPAVLFWFFYFVRPTVFGSKSLSTNLKRELIYVQIESILRKVLAVISAFMIAGFADKIPYLNLISGIAQFLADNFNTSVIAIEALIGVVLGLISQFNNSSRFETRLEIEPRKIEL